MKHRIIPLFLLLCLLPLGAYAEQLVCIGREGQ